MCIKRLDGDYFREFEEYVQNFDLVSSTVFKANDFDGERTGKEW